jgi:Ribbon-helix-helix protein, copG family
MRTTITLADDVAAAVEDLRRREGIGVSEALNRIARAGLASPRSRPQFRQRVHRMGRPLIDISNVEEALELAEGPEHK